MYFIAGSAGSSNLSSLHLRFIFCSLVSLRDPILSGLRIVSFFQTTTNKNVEDTSPSFQSVTSVSMRKGELFVRALHCLKEEKYQQQLHLLSPLERQDQYHNKCRQTIIINQKEWRPTKSNAERAASKRPAFSNGPGGNEILPNEHWSARRLFRENPSNPTFRSFGKNRNVRLVVVVKPVVRWSRNGIISIRWLFFSK